MISRYSTPAMNHIWSDLNKFDKWLEIEKLVVEEWHRLGLIPTKDAIAIRDDAIFTIDKIEEYERRTKHDFAAFVDVISESVGESGRWIHYGLTSSDVIDTALSLQMREALNQIGNHLDHLITLIWRLQSSYNLQLMVGRTHGMFAEPITFGHKLRLWALELQRHQKRLSDAKEIISVGSISGTVGTYSTVDPRVEEGVCLALDLRSEPSKQIIARDRHAEFVWVLASIATTLDSIATEIRLLSRSEVMEVQESFSDLQKGSSAMPHKQNPVRCERISGLARIVRGYVATALENNVTWHERDISHSSVERIMLPDSSNIVDFMLIEMYDILNTMKINTIAMEDHLDSNDGIIYSHRVMLALIKSGMSRQESYKIIQDIAKQSFEKKESFKKLIYINKEIVKYLKDEEINRCFDPKVQRSFPEYDTMMFEEVR